MPRRVDYRVRMLPLPALRERLHPPGSLFRPRELLPLELAQQRNAFRL